MKTIKIHYERIENEDSLYGLFDNNDDIYKYDNFTMDLDMWKLYRKSREEYWEAYRKIINYYVIKQR